MIHPPPSVLVAVPLGVAAGGDALIPAGTSQDLGYAGVGLACMVVAFAGLIRSRTRPAKGWLLVLAGFSGWVAGDVMFLIEQEWLHLSALPAPSDALYIGSYVLLAAGLVAIVRRRGTRGGLAAVLDALILATGTGVVVGVFLIAPIAHDSGLSLLGRLTSSLYPIADVLLLAILVQLWTTAGVRTVAHRLLAAALGVTLLADGLYNLTSIVGGDIDSLPVSNLLWLSGYVLMAAATWSRSAEGPGEPPPGREDLSNPTTRLVVLTGGLVLPGLALVGDGLNGGGVSWAIIAIGSVVLSLLVLSRMAGLLAVVRGQAVQLAALAGLDPLTGVANRRTLDHELSQRCRVARDERSLLSVALLDLDHFKLYNDTHGHPAGDRLLRGATAAWSDVLASDETLARYGGEEFVVLFPGLSATEAGERVIQLLDVMPHGQTFSAGVATWGTDTEPGAALAAADIALYHAKRGGRRRVCLVTDGGEVVTQHPTVAGRAMVVPGAG